MICPINVLNKYIKNLKNKGFKQKTQEGSGQYEKNTCYNRKKQSG